MIADKIEALLADKGYDADAIREELTKADVEAVIPAKSNRREPIATNGIVAASRIKVKQPPQDNLLFSTDAVEHESYCALVSLTTGHRTTQP